MVLPLYKDHRANFHSPQGGHSGLWYTRFFDGFAQTGTTEQHRGWEVPKEVKEGWISRTGDKCGNKNALERACVRQLNLVEALTGRSRVFTTCWHFVTGLGLPHPVENGFAWHPTLGVPFLCGAAVKGLLKAWIEDTDELSNETKESRLEEWFGSQDSAGQLIFLDAIPCDLPLLAPDIMTPHQDKWYLDGGSITSPDGEPEKVPADWHDPVPVPFLVVRDGGFLFSIAPRTREAVPQIEAALEALECALDELGAGAKTAVGYGQMKKDSAALKKISAAKSKHDADAQEAIEKQAKAAEIAAMSPLDREVAEYLAEHANEPAHLVLLKALERGKWVEAEARQVAQETQRLMRAVGVWRLSYQGKNRAKKKNYDRSQKIRAFLGQTESKS